MAEFREDDQIYPLLIAIAEAVRVDIATSGLPVITHVAVQPGIEPVIDFAGNGKECGEIIVNMVGAAPTNSDAAGTLNGCTGEMQYTAAVAVFRCAVIPKGKPPVMPNAADQLNSTRLHLADMRASKRGICTALKGQAYELVDFTPYGPDGAVVGGVWTVLIGGPS